MSLYDHNHSADDPHPFSPFLAALGRGPGRSRNLTREEAREAMGMVLDGRADPIQVGAFLLLLRYRAENAEEIAGMVEAVRAHEGLPPCPNISNRLADLDWPSYAAGKSRGAPWFLLAALLVARAGVRVGMHGFNSHLTAGAMVEEALAALDLTPAANLSDAQDQMDQTGFSYLPLRHFSPVTQSLLGLRPVLGLRTAINTVVRLIDPMDAPASFIGIFHPPYLDVQIEGARTLGIKRAGVIKGGGGEAERNPFKPCLLSLTDEAASKWPSLLEDQSRGNRPPKTSLDYMLQVWRGETDDEVCAAMVTGTAAQALYIAGKANTPEAAQQMALALWDSR